MTQNQLLLVYCPEVGSSTEAYALSTMDYAPLS